MNDFPNEDVSVLTFIGIAHFELDFAAIYSTIWLTFRLGSLCNKVWYNLRPERGGRERGPKGDSRQTCADQLRSMSPRPHLRSRSKPPYCKLLPRSPYVKYTFFL